jgi:hypothetical protein
LKILPEWNFTILPKMNKMEAVACLRLQNYTGGNIVIMFLDCGLQPLNYYVSHLPRSHPPILSGNITNSAVIHKCLYDSNTGHQFTTEKKLTLSGSQGIRKKHKNLTYELQNLKKLEDQAFSLIYNLDWFGRNTTSWHFNVYFTSHIASSL